MPDDRVRGSPTYTAEPTVALCAYCQSELGEEAWLTCPECHSRHHGDCWNENGGCALAGCSACPGATRVVTVAATVPLSASTAWLDRTIAPVAGPDRPAVQMTTGEPNRDVVAPPARRHRPALRLTAAVAVVVALPVLAAVGTRSNWFAPVTGRLITVKESDAAVRTAYDAGHSAGQTAGYAAGQTAGYAAGQSAGYSAGQSSGYASGRAAAEAGRSAAIQAAHDGGYTQGQSDGYSTGYASGSAEGYATGYSCGISSSYWLSC